jgi:lipoate-protein ligase A
MEASRDDPHALAENPEPRKPFLCFLDRDPVDVVVLGPARDQGGVAVDMEMKSESESESKSESGLSRPAKVLGSAQRRRGRALLQHGSLLLTTAAPANELVGLADLPRQSAAVRVADAPAGFAPESWVCPWARRLAEALEARLEWREPEPEERERGRVLSEVYRNPAWLFKR